MSELAETGTVDTVAAEAAILACVQRFYEKGRVDPLLGPNVANSIVELEPHAIARARNMTQFFQSGLFPFEDAGSLPSRMPDRGQSFHRDVRGRRVFVASGPTLQICGAMINRSTGFPSWKCDRMISSMSVSVRGAYQTPCG